MLTAAVLLLPMTGTFRNTVSGLPPWANFPAPRREKRVGMEQDGSTSCLTVFKILGCCLLRDHVFICFLLTNETSVGGSDGEGRSIRCLVGQNTWQRTLPLNAQLLRLDWSFPKLYKHVLSNLRVDFFLETRLGHGLVLLLMFPFWAYGV